MTTSKINEAIIRLTFPRWYVTRIFESLIKIKPLRIKGTSVSYEFSSWIKELTQMSASISTPTFQNPFLQLWDIFNT